MCLDYAATKTRYSRAAHVGGMLVRAMKAVTNAVTPLAWESLFPPPQHPKANAVRRWLAVSHRDTLWREEGLRILPVLA